MPAPPEAMTGTGTAPRPRRSGRGRSRPWCRRGRCWSAGSPRRRARPPRGSRPGRRARSPAGRRGSPPPTARLPTARGRRPRGPRTGCRSGGASSAISSGRSTAAELIPTLSAPAAEEPAASSAPRTPPPTVSGMKTCSPCGAPSRASVSRSSGAAPMSRKTISSAPCARSASAASPGSPGRGGSAKPHPLHHPAGCTSRQGMTRARDRCDRSDAYPQRLLHGERPLVERAPDDRAGDLRHSRRRLEVGERADPAREEGRDAARRAPPGRRARGWARSSCRRARRR